MATFAKKRAYRGGPKLTGPEQFAHAFEGFVAHLRCDYVPDAIPLDVLTAKAMTWLETSNPASLARARSYFTGTGFKPPIMEAVLSYFHAVRADGGNTSPGTA